MKWNSLPFTTTLVLAVAASVSAQQLPYSSSSTAPNTIAAMEQQWPDASPAIFLGTDLARPIQNVSFYSNLGGEDGCCQKGCCGDCCCPPVWAHRSGVFGEFLYLRPRDAEVAYAVPVDSVLGPPDVQIGPVAITDPDYSPGYRVGGMLALDDCTSIEVAYSRLGTNTSHSIDLNPTAILRPLLIHPGTGNAGSNYLTGFAANDVDFDLIDVAYRAVWRAGDLWAVNYSVGSRYGRIEEDFQALYLNSGANPDEFLRTEIDFDGGGIRLGLDVERHACNNGLMAYAKVYASLLAGDFRADYLEGSTADPEIINTSWKAGRVVPILDLEVGTGWQSPCGHYRVTGGYSFSAWFNSLTTDEWIQAVHANSYTNLDETVTFDGFSLRAEYRF